jgi:hypothetical protein
VEVGLVDDNLLRHGRGQCVSSPRW